ncbi:MAG: NUDIX domain-containing protein, partial [Mycobacterium sp.]
MRHSATELLLRAPDAQGKPQVLMQRESASTRSGEDRWALPGGARRSDEKPVDTAVRVAEQLGVDPRSMRVRGGRGADGSSHATVIADVSQPCATQPTGHGRELAWVPEPEVGTLDLDPALMAGWPALQAPETGLLVDAANVVGSRPDGWWRDRAGAATRLLGEIAAAGPSVFAVGDGRFQWVTRPVVVLEGAAKRAPDVAGVEVVRAPGSGDDTIVDIAHRGGDWVVVTAD